MTMTKHGIARTKERCGIGKSLRKMERFANNALERGYKRDETRGALRKYLDGRYYEFGFGDMRIYAGQLFVFEGENLVTVFPIPGKLQMGIKEYVVV